MNILIDIRLLSRGGQSGVEEYTKNIVDNLIKTSPKHQLKLFYNGWQKSPLPAHWLKAENVSVIDWPCPNKLFRIINPKIDKIIKTDIVFSPHINFLNHGNTPHILTIHDLSFIHYPNFFSFRHRLWHYLQNIKKQTERASHIITDSEFSKNDISSTFQIPSEKISVVYPGINKILKSPLQNFKFKISNLKYILYLGTLEPRKNISAIIGAFNIIKSDSRFADLKLVLAGKPGWLFKLKEQKDIIFWGEATEEEKAFLYSGAAIFIYPSFFEGFGFPPLEAQMYNCPVIASNRSSLPEILLDSALFINPWRIDRLAAKIIELLNNKLLSKKLIERGQENIKRFSWKKCTSELLNIFSSFC